MPTLSVELTPWNPGVVEVRVATVSGSYAWTGQASTEAPLNQHWDDLPSGDYAITIAWNKGYQNMAPTIGNSVIYNGMPLYYQVLGTPADGNGVSATFPFTL
jgi:hypothetical protein